MSNLPGYAGHAGHFAETRGRIVHSLNKEERLETDYVGYEAPRLVDTFDAIEVLGAAEGVTCGNGSGMGVAT